MPARSQRAHTTGGKSAFLDGYAVSSARQINQIDPYGPMRTIAKLFRFPLALPCFQRLTGFAL